MCESAASVTLTRTMRLATFASLLLTTAACQSTQAPAELGFVSLGRGTQSGITTPGVRVASDANAWKVLWAEHARLQLPQPPAPQVDFARYRAAIVIAGQRTSGGYSISVEAVRPRDGKLTVHAFESVPASGTAQSQALTCPFEIVLVPAGTEPLELLVRY